jgi:putative flippase GtrA
MALIALTRPASCQRDGGDVHAGMQAVVVDADGQRQPGRFGMAAFQGTCRRMTALRRIAFFIAVGCAAGAVHFGAVVLLVEWLGASPLLANVLGWLLAFGVSFTGQSRLTFRSHGTHWTVALPRFFAVSLSGFVLNEAGYALLLHWTALPYDLCARPWCWLRWPS